ncbi:MAG: hypothetical protein N2485_03855 [bacterium]|nr:hypothetical protein [bacterium]
MTKNSKNPLKTKKEKTITKTEVKLIDKKITIKINKKNSFIFIIYYSFI